MGVAYDIILWVITGRPEVYPHFLMVYFNDMNGKLGPLMYTGPPQPMNYTDLSLLLVVFTCSSLYFNSLNIVPK